MPEREASQGLPVDSPDRDMPALAAIPKAAHLPGVLLLVAIWAAWLLHLDTGMLDWGFSAAALEGGRGENLFLHMFAHANLMHIAFNSIVLFSLSGPLLTWMGGFPGNWLRYLAFYLLSGLGGAALFLALNPEGDVPMIGASGAISGLIGLAARLSGEHRGLVPLFSAEMGRRIWHFAKANLWLVLIFAVPVVLGIGGGGIAWEAHLGGFLVGIIGARFFLVDAHG